MNALAALSQRVDQAVFDALYARSLVYNTCWEDPAVDRLALSLGPHDTVLAITSAGCNVLDYALTAPRRIYAVDANPRQTALLELKLAGIRQLDHAEFFQIFGAGQHPKFVQIYRDCLRQELTPTARGFWDQRTHWFSGSAGGFYFFGLAGQVARAFRGFLKVQPRLRAPLLSLFETASLNEQRELYEREVAPRLWRGVVNWTLSRQLTLSMLGVPHPQRREVLAQHRHGVAGFVRESIDYLARHLPFSNNYFYGVYVRGRYTADCCPEYLKPAQFARLQRGLAARIEPHTCTVTEFLRRTPTRISRFVLLDHMDWMSSYQPQALVEEWTEILAAATPAARIIFRSAHAQPRYLDDIALGAARWRLKDLLAFNELDSRRLSRLDRVHTYAGFHIADVLA